MTNPAARPLLVTADPGMKDAVLAVAAEACVELSVVADLAAAVTWWSSAPLVLVDAAALTAGALPSSRPGLVFVTRAVDDPAVWRHLVSLRAEHIVELPEGAPWLFERFGRSLESDPAGDLVVVVGASGGCGATTVAAALARHAHEHLDGGVLVDLDPWGGGADLLVGAETRSGARWDELAGVGGRVNEAVVRQALPTCDGLPILSWPALSEIEPDATAIGHVLDGLARGPGVVVVDVGRASDARCTAVFARSSRAVIVVPMRVRAVSSARRVLHRLPQHIRPLVVAREPAPGGLTADDLSAALGVAVTATVADDRRRASIEEFGGPPPSSAMWRRLCSSLLEAPVELAA